MSIAGLLRRLAAALVPTVVLLAPGLAGPAAAQATPRYGGELIMVVPTEPPSYDAHREGMFALIHPGAPHYNTLLRIDPTDRTGTKVVGDLAESWTVADGGRRYTLELRRGVRFHDGAELTSRDVKASYDKIIFPPKEVSSFRKGQYVDVEVGTGPFTFVEHVKGAHWIGKRNPNYWDKGQPYLDGYRAIFVRDSAAQVAAIRAERAHVQFRGFTPAERDSIVGALGNRITVQESPWDCVLLVTSNHDKKPWDDRRVRRALTLALDRYQASEALSKIAIVKLVAGVQVPGTPFATPPEELEKLAGYGRDIRAARAEARRLLREAGVPDGYSFSFKNRGVPMPYEAVGVWLIDQWRQIGLNARHEFQEPGTWDADRRSGNFEVAMDTQCGYVVDPDLDTAKFQSTGVSGNNYARYTDRVLDELYTKQSRAVDPEERRRYVRQFERRLLDEEAHYLYTLQWHRIVPHSARLRGWTITPSHYLNNQLDTVWLSE
jgi:peptide/nickel transport system substrate-binding protein